MQRPPEEFNENTPFPDEDVMILPGGGKKCATAIGVASVLKEKNQLKKYKTIYGGSGNNILAAAIVGDQLEKLIQAMEAIEAKHTPKASGVISFEHKDLFKFLNIPDLIKSYKEVDFDVDAILNSAQGLVIPVTNFDTGLVEYYGNNIAVKNSQTDDLIQIKSEEMFWKVIELSQKMPLMSGLRYTRNREIISELSSEPPARRGDSYNSAGYQFAARHAVENQSARAIVCFNTSKTPNPETDQNIASHISGLRATKWNYKFDRQERMEIDKEVRKSKTVSGVRIRFPDIRDDHGSFPVTKMGEKGFRVNFDHGVRKANEWFSS